MSSKSYGNFVRPASPSEETVKQPTLSGEQAKKLYLEEVQDIKDPVPTSSDAYLTTRDNRIRDTPKIEEIHLSKNKLFLSAQNNDVDTLRLILDNNPDEINVVDDYGWSLLMIACQANSIETVKELLKRKINMYVRDKAGNSAQSLVIKSKNLVLVDLLLSHRSEHVPKAKVKSKSKHRRVKDKEHFVCEVCNKTFPDKEEHLSSTIHNITASKGRKIPTSYVIPESNRGYQIMLRVGWDKESGLGPDGTGHKYPIRTVQKKDRKGLGMEKKKKQDKAKEETVRNMNRKILERDFHRHKRMEVNFRREFY